MANPIKLIVYSTKNIEAAKQLLHTFLGIDPYVDSPYYVGFKVEGLEVGLTPSHQEHITGPIAYTDVSDIKASLQSLVDAGATVVQKPKDVGNGLLVASVQDADGNILGLRQAA
ncbi:glyoxalase [Candidatus Cerribacteria bacterium 'Amazon FNV 2010 28 9']|uniref:Glyoxalase n=1 Tax=Candidatus Cerribacteria bacterium 'Amazon FNV 2010 28 9' TaxID=2081795 RepID=A0A317JT28_9BACT|nr:MAG: glyoxalase [Candidatus Cerribacteria bacterium 'Amazon FNV 2010 28 9']